MNPTDPLAAALQSIESEFEVVLGKLAPVEEACRVIRSHVAARPDAKSAQHCCRRLLPLLEKRQGPLAAVLFDLLEELVPAAADVHGLVAGLAAVRDESLRPRVLELLLRCIEADKLPMSFDRAADLAGRVEDEASGGREPRVLARIGALLGRLALDAAPSAAATASADPVANLFASAPSLPVRRLAARVLDRDGALPSPELANRVLGDEAAGILGAYLHYTRATHRDLVDLAPVPGAAPPALGGWMQAEKALGKELFASILAELGWSRVAWGVQVEHLVGLSVEGSFPCVVSPAEAELLTACGPARRVWERFVVIAHGAQPESGAESASGDAIQRFRAYNVCHAELLGEILEIAPLTAAKARRILQRLDRIVEDFVCLFADHTPEAGRLPQVYAGLRERIVACTAGVPEAQLLPVETTRLVQMFEDPRCLDDVRTLHGLKRYLHQLGLRLAFRAFRSSRTTNRSVDIVLASRERMLHVAPTIRYVDFDPEPGASGMELPFAVALVAKSLASQLVHELRALPRVEIFVYGNEVQVFVGYRNHPAFMRVDLSPPQRGGMLDLEYFGVSQYEMAQHPDLTLQGIRGLFRGLDFDVSLDGFRLHVRYDKERAFDLGDILSKAESMFRLLPYLMDVDWVIGGLDYPETSRRRVAEAWADFFARWGVLPMHAFLTSDRRAVLQSRTQDPAGEHEVPWDGADAYRDVFSGCPPPESQQRLRNALAARGLLGLVRWEAVGSAPLAQLALQRGVLEPLRDGVARGEARIAAGRFEAVALDDFRREHEAERLARILDTAGEPLQEAMRLAPLVGSLERQLRFRTTGSVQGYAVQRAMLPLRGEPVGLYVLRAANGIVAAAVAARNGVLFRRRDRPEGDWVPNACVGPRELTLELRRDNYLAEGYEPPEGTLEPLELARRFRVPNPAAPGPATAGSRVVPGIAASPGKATGFAVFGTQGRAPEDFEDAVLVAAVIAPEATPWLRHAAAAVSTGGGMLSHIGLIALEMQKPALIVDGRWDRDAGGAPVLVYRRPEFQEDEQSIGPYRVVCRRDLTEIDETLQEGDLVVVDADAASLTVLGQDRDALAVHRELRQLEKAAGGLAQARDAAEVLVYRGRLLRAMHQLERLLGRIDRPELAGHAIAELLHESGASARTAEREGRKRLVSALFENRLCGAAAFAAARQHVAAVARRHEALSEEAARTLPHLDHVSEVLYLRLLVLRTARLLEDLGALLAGRGLVAADLAPRAQLDELARARLEERRRVLSAAMVSVPNRPDARWVRRQLLQLDGVLGPPSAEARDRVCRQCEDEERTAAAELGRRRVVSGRDGGFEIRFVAGSKAANLSEIARVLGPQRVPDWCAVTDAAFREAMASPAAGSCLEALGLDRCHGGTLGEAIHEILERRDMDPGRKAAAVRSLWESAPLAVGLVREIAAAYRSLRGGADSASDGAAFPSVAIRSSAFEEDTPAAAWAGQFDTFLFVSGEEALLHHLKLAWAGLWTERAIHQRETLRIAPESTGGGVIVQRMVDARVSGVLQTACVASGQLREMVINVGLGLGEGVVSGIVDVDHILVSKEGDLEHDPLRCRYRVGDKRQRVVFDARSGFGTRLEETLYHQRLRAALEYVELCELVRAASRLESFYGQPLDIEFAYEGTELRILQARPIGVFHAALQETSTRFPFAVRSQHEGVSRDSPR